MTIVGKVFKSNERKILALNRCLSEYHKLVKWYLCFKSTSKMFLHKNGYEEAKRGFDLNTALNTALIQTREKRLLKLLSVSERTGKPTAYCT